MGWAPGLQRESLESWTGRQLDWLILASPKMQSEMSKFPKIQMPDYKILRDQISKIYFCVCVWGEELILKFLYRISAFGAMEMGLCLSNFGMNRGSSIQSRERKLFGFVSWGKGGKPSPQDLGEEGQKEREELLGQGYPAGSLSGTGMGRAEGQMGKMQANLGVLS